MPFLRKGILMPVEGVDWSKPSTFISDTSGYPQNMRFLANEICKRPGKSLYGATAISDATQIMGLGVLELPTLKYLIRASKTQLERYNTTTLIWDSILTTPLSGGDEDFVSFANVTESKFIAFTNGVDKIRKWTGSGNNSALGGNPPLAKYMTYLSPYLVIAYVTEGGDIKPWKIRWCDTDAPETWTGGNAGSALIASEPSAIQNIMKLNEYIATYKEESLWLGVKVGTSDIFEFNCMKTGIGLSAPRCVIDFEGKHAFMGHNDFYVWNGIREESIGGPIRDLVFPSLDRSKLKRCFGLHIKNLTEVWFFILTTGQTWPTEVWKYNYRTGFWYYDTCSNLTAAVAWKKITTESWDDDTPGDWDSAIDVWDAGEVMQDWEEVMFGNSAGNTLKLDYSTTNDLGVAVSSMFETKDYTMDVLEFYKRWLQLDVWVRGSTNAKLYVDYSDDYGDTWTNIPYTSSTAYITLSATTQLFRLYFDIVADHIRFRFRNAESGEIFYLRNFYPYYLASAEVKE
mgnify:CR=1 FL=1